MMCVRECVRKREREGKSLPAACRDVKTVSQQLQRDADKGSESATAAIDYFSLESPV